MGLPCPACGNTATQRLSAIWNEGTSTVWAAGYQGTASTQAALDASPPTQRHYLGQYWFFVGMGALASVGGIVGFFKTLFEGKVLVESVAGLGLGILLAIGVWRWIRGLLRERKWNREEWPKAYAEWERTWYCSDCDRDFVEGDRPDR